MWIDIIIIGIIALFVFTGYRKGFIKNLLYLLSWVGAVAVAWIGCKSIEAVMESSSLLTNWFTNHITFVDAGTSMTVLAFLVILVAFKIVANVALAFVNAVGKKTGLKTVDQIFGAAIGAAKAIIIICILALVLVPYAYSGLYPELAKACTSSNILPIIDTYNPIKNIYETGE